MKNILEIKSDDFAFPFEGIVLNHGDEISKSISSPGMSLRDYFAAKCMQGVLANNQCTPMGMSFDPNSLSKIAYGMADAMLKARNGNVG